MYVSVHGSGRFVMSAHYGSGDVVVFQVNADGSLGSVVASAYLIHSSFLLLLPPPTTSRPFSHAHLLNLFLKSTNILFILITTRKAGQLAHQVLIVGNYVFVPCKGSDYIAQYVSKEEERRERRGGKGEERKGKERRGEEKTSFKSALTAHRSSTPPRML